MAYTAAGLSPDGGSTHILPRLVGMQRAKELILTNRILTADQAFEWGLLTKVCADDEVMAEANALAQYFASGAIAAYGSAKRLLADTYVNSLEEQMAAESIEIAERAADSDGREGCAAFAEKRKPKFA
jgi:2-(1,2-epoxy-1,2-dihydrophenyl)acetyl-CoA isomerase